MVGIGNLQINKYVSAQPDRSRTGVRQTGQHSVTHPQALHFLIEDGTGDAEEFGGFDLVALALDQSVGDVLLLLFVDLPLNTSGKFLSIIGGHWRLRGKIEEQGQLPGFKRAHS